MMNADSEAFTACLDCIPFAINADEMHVNPTRDAQVAES